MKGNQQKGVILILVSAFCVCIGQLFWKLGSSQTSVSLIIIGFILYGVGALVMIKAYTYGSVSILQPLLSVSYILSIVLGAIVFSEPITPTKIFAICFIMFGAIVIGGSKT